MRYVTYYKGKSDQTLGLKLPINLPAGDEIHIFHVVPTPQSKLLGAGIGLADAGEFMVAPPDPSDDKRQVLQL